MDDPIQSCQAALGIPFQNSEILRRALTHASTGEGHGGHNERLEFLGDAVLTLVVTQFLFEEHPHLTEGEMTEFKGGIVSGPELALAGTRLGLDRWIRVGRGIARERSLPRSILANTFEALVGAIYLDAGLEAARRFALRTLGDQIERALSGGRNFKMLLQNLGQREYGEVPSYRVLARGGPAFARSFQVAAFLHGKEFAPAWGKTKKEAEQWAAREALLAIESEASKPREEGD